jgi:predicted transcriptional regulator
MKSKTKAELSYPRRIRKRSDIDVMASILKEAHEGARKTHIMYRCNLSHIQLRVYLKLLLGMGFLAFNSEKDSDELGLFETTVKGLKFLDAYRTLKALMT